MLLVFTSNARSEINPVLPNKKGRQIEERKEMKRILTTAVFCVISFFLLTAESCEKSTQQRSLSGAEQVLNIYKVPKNFAGMTCEQQNINDKNRVTTDPTKVMWIHLVALDGKIIRRMPVRNKITSSGKRLEPTHAVDAAELWRDFRGD